MGRVRLQDVAEASGVSIATASIVLSGNRERRISPSTCSRVRAAAATLGYTAPPVPRTMGTIGVLLDVDGDDAAAKAVIEAIHNAARPIAAPVLFTPVHRRGATQFGAKSLLRRGAESLVFVSKRFQTLAGLQGVPWRSAFINCVPGPDVHAPGSWTVVLPDHRQVAEGVAERLIRQGHVRLLLGGADPGDPVAGDWVSGVRTEAAAWAPGVFVDVVAGAAEDVPAQVARALTKPADLRPTAAIALGPGTASVILDVASRLGLSVPDDLLLLTRSPVLGEEPALPSAAGITTSAAVLADAAIEALSTAAPWRIGEAGPRVIRVHQRGDARRPGGVPTARSA